MTYDEVKEITKDWKEPFRTVVFYPNFSIDFKLNEGKSDHEWLKKHGYELYMGGDCAYYVKKVSNLLATSYGDWGTCYVSENKNNKQKIDKGFELFIEMYKDGIVKPWRISIRVLKQEYHYDDNYGIWTTYNGDEWLECDNPLIMMKTSKND